MFNRRQVLGGIASGFFTFSLRNQVASAFSQIPQGRAKRCVVLWMEGGPSQLDTFDPKPKTANGGPVNAIRTSSSAIEIADTLPHLAKQMDNLSVVRNLTSNEGEHLRASYYLHTGYPFVPSFPRPAFGSVISHELGFADIPNYVQLGGNGFGPAYMGPEHAPFVVENPEQAKQLFSQLRRRTGRLGLLQKLDQSFNTNHPDPRAQQRRATLQKIQTMASTSFADALDINRTSISDRNRYGNGEFGQRCLIARQLLEQGVRFIEVQQPGWDTHVDNFRNVANLCGEIDRPFAALIQDLQAAGMWDDTLIIWMGEFGRTPTINANRGRDHFPDVTPIVLGGGVVKTGKAVGQTDKLGRKIDGHSYTVADLFATMFSVFGIEADREFTTDFDSPTTATEEGKIITELV